MELWFQGIVLKTEITFFVNLQVKKVKVQWEMLMASNRSLAEYNLQQQPKLESRKHQLYEAHQNKAAIQEVFEKNKQKLGKVSLNVCYF